MNKALAFGFALSLALAGRGQAQETFDHSVFDQLLARYVRKGQVDYTAWKAKDQGQLFFYLNKVAHADVDKLKPKDEKLAFYLNAYNAVVVAQVLENLPLKSTKDVKGFSDRLKHLVGNKPYTLDELARTTRELAADPRIHFALNGGAQGYPPLADRAFRGDSLASQLDSATAHFITATRYVRLDKKARVLYLSRIFEWNAEEFEVSTGSVRNFLKLNLPEDFRQALEEEPYELKYLPFDWSLNGK